MTWVSWRPARLRLPARLRRPLAMGLWLLWGLGLVAGIAPAVYAQTDDPTTDETEGEGADTTATEEDDFLEGEEPPPQPQGPGGTLAPSDTASISGLFSPLHPSYSTTYDVSRQVTNWNQDFEFGATFGGFNLENGTRYNVRNDTGRDETVKEGSNLTNLRMIKFPLNLVLDLRRSSLNNPDTKQQDDDVRLGLTSRDIKKDLFKVPGEERFRMTHRFTVGGGLSHRADERLVSKRTTRNYDNGLEANAGWRGNWDPMSYLRLDGDARWSRTQKKSRSQQDTVTVSTPTANVNRAFGMGVKLHPSKWLSSSLSANSTLTDDETYQLVSSGPGLPPTSQLERRFGNRRAVTGQVEFKPNWNKSTLRLDFSQARQEQDYRLRKDFAYTGNTFSWGGNYKGTLWGTDVEIKLASSKDEMDRATSAGQETHNNSLDGKLQRRLSSKFQARFNWLVRANQIFFDDASLDRDEQRTKFSPWVSYRPNKKWTVSASYTRSTTRRSEINPRQALQSRNEEDYSVDVDVTYQLSARSSVSQAYSIKAIYTTYDYNPRADGLLTTQGIITTLKTGMGPGFDLLFEHRFSLQDSGPFRFESDGTRVFERDLRKYRQELTSQVTYKFTSWASAVVRSLFLRTDDVNVFLDQTFTRRNLTLNTGLSFQKTLRGAVQIRAAGDYVQSNTTDSYWSLRSGLSKDF